MNTFTYIDTVILVLLGLGNYKTRRVIKKDLNRIKLHLSVLGISRNDATQKPDQRND